MRKPWPDMFTRLTEFEESVILLLSEHTARRIESHEMNDGWDEEQMGASVRKEEQSYVATNNHRIFQ